MQLAKVTFEYEFENGSKLTRTLEGGDAELWERWLKDVCRLALIHNKNPDWGSLHWQEQKQETNDQDQV